MKYKARLDQFDLICDPNITDDLEKHIVNYEVPFAFGASHDDMGVKDRTIKLKTIWNRDLYSSHIAFVTHVRTNSTFTLIHPHEGTVIGRIQSCNVKYDDRTQFAEIYITFLEDIQAEPGSYIPSLVPAIENAIVRAQALQMESVVDDVAQYTSTDSASTIVSMVLDPAQPILTQMKRVIGSVRNFIGQIDNEIAALDGLVTDITLPAEAISFLVEYGTTMPGRIMNSVTRCIERYAYAMRNINNSPLLFAQNFNAAVNGLQTKFKALKKQITIVAAQVASHMIAQLLVVDEENRQKLRRAEVLNPWSPNGTLMFVPQIPLVLSAGELDKTLALSRELAQAAINTIRGDFGSADLISEIKATTAAAMSYVDMIKLERDRIITIQVNDPIPLHALCVQYGLPYMYAERICAVNDFWNPSFVEGEVKIYARQN